MGPIQGRPGNFSRREQGRASGRSRQQTLAENRKTLAKNREQIDQDRTANHLENNETSSTGVLASIPRSKRKKDAPYGASKESAVPARPEVDEEQIDLEVYIAELGPPQATAPPGPRRSLACRAAPASRRRTTLGTAHCRAACASENDDLDAAGRGIGLQGCTRSWCRPGAPWA